MLLPFHVSRLPLYLPPQLVLFVVRTVTIGIVSRTRRRLALPPLMGNVLLTATTGTALPGRQSLLRLRHSPLQPHQLLPANPTMTIGIAHRVYQNLLPLRRRQPQLQRLLSVPVSRTVTTGTARQGSRSLRLLLLRLPLQGLLLQQWPLANRMETTGIARLEFLSPQPLLLKPLPRQEPLQRLQLVSHMVTTGIARQGFPSLRLPPLKLLLLREELLPLLHQQPLVNRTEITGIVHRACQSQLPLLPKLLLRQELQAELPRPVPVNHMETTGTARLEFPSQLPCLRNLLRPERQPLHL